MSALSPKVQALLEAARSADLPAPHTRGRIRSALDAQMAIVPAAAGATKGILAVKVVLVGVLAAGGGLAVRSLRTAPAATPTGVAHAVPRSARLDAPPAPEVFAAVAVTAAPRQPATVRHVRPPAPRDLLPTAPAPVANVAEPAGLEVELELLSTAQGALQRHDPSQALDALDEHAARFPSGTLRPERMAGRALALCELGRLTEARLEARAFLEAFPTSPLAARVKQSCAGPTPQAP
jgi:hypothetical protein